jgi:Cd2+/Zn2+-exporting ATPase
VPTNNKAKHEDCCKACAANQFQNQTTNFDAVEKDSAKKKFSNLITVKTRLIVSLSLFVIGLAFSFANQNAISNIIFYVAYVIIGYSIVLGAFKNLFTGHLLDEKFLMTIASLGAFGVGQVSEGVAVMLFYMVGETFNDYAMDRSKRSIEKLMKLKPDIAHVIRDNNTIDIEPNSVKIGDIIVIKAGERVPLDSIVIEGQSTLDTSALTGESLPVDVENKAEILSGSVNGSGILKAEVIKTFDDSTFSRILKMVENASSKKAKSEVFIRKFSHYYTPIVVVLALLTTIIPTVFLGLPFETWFYRSLMFLVVSCPCALVLSVPLAFFGGIGAAAKKGVLIKGGSFIEQLAKVDTFVFDKTGTLTEGKFSITEIKTYDYKEKDALKFAALAESNSTHPIAVSIVNEYLNRNKLDKIDSIAMDINEEFGKGIVANIDGKNILVGSSDFLLSKKVPINGNNTEISTLVQIAIDNIHVATIFVGDTLKVDSKASLHGLKKQGVKRLVMLSGDRDRIALKIGRDAGIDEVKSQLLPQDKVVNLEKIMQTSNITAFVGDGINDAPSIARSDIGIAMGALGSDAAIEASDVVIIGEELTSLPKLIKLSKKTLRIAKQNIVFAIGVKVIIMILALFGLGTMWIAVFGDVGVSILAVLNSLRMLRDKD